MKLELLKLFKSLVMFICLLGLHPGGWATGMVGHPCVVAFDLGSSGIRVGATHSDLIVESRFDYFGAYMKSGSMDGSLSQLVDSLKTLLDKTESNSECRRLAGGFSVWRMSLAKEPDRLKAMLKSIHDTTGVAIFVITQSREGRYAFEAAKAKLGSKLDTTHILDLGGGSFQVSDSSGGVGLQLGQKSVYQLLCQQLKMIRSSAPESDCSLDALSTSELESLRQYMREHLKIQLPDLVCALPHCVKSLTAISRPVTKGVYPMLGKLGMVSRPGVMLQSELSAAINSIAPLSLSGLTSKLDLHGNFSQFLISDSIFLEAVTKQFELSEIKVAEVEVNNVYGLSRDITLQSLSSRFDCYLFQISSSQSTDFEAMEHTCRKEELERKPLP